MTQESKSLNEEQTSWKNSTKIIIEGQDGKGLSVILGSLIATVLVIGLCSGVVICTAFYVVKSWEREIDRQIAVTERETDRQNTQYQLMELQMNEMGLLLVREGIKKPGDIWYGAILNEVKQKDKQQKEDK